MSLETTAGNAALEAISQSGAQIDLDVRSRLEGNLNTKWLEHRYGQTPILKAIQVAGYNLRKRPDEPLTDAVIPFEDTAPTASKIFLNILNTSLVPDTETPHRVESRGARDGSACMEAEAYFKVAAGIATDADWDWLHKVGNEIPMSRTERSVTFFQNQGQTVLMKKYAGQQTGLSFQDIVINGVSYPAGSIFRVESNPLRGRMHKNSGGQMVETKALAAVSKMAFLRLSPLALDGAERDEEFPSDVLSNGHELPDLLVALLGDQKRVLPGAGLILRASRAIYGLA